MTGSGKASRSLLGNYRDTWAATDSAGRRFLIATFFIGLYFPAFFVFFPLYLKQRGFNNAEIGLFLAATWFVEIIAGVLITWLAGRGHVRITLIIGTLMSAVAVVAIPQFGPGAKLPILVCCLVAGLAAAVYWILGDPLLTTTTRPEMRARLFALKFFFITLATALGSGLGGWIPASLQSAGLTELRALGYTHYFIAAIVVMAAIVFATIHPQPETETHHSAMHDLPVAWSRRSMILFMAVLPQCFLAFGINSVRPFLSLFLQNSHDLRAGSAGTVIMVMSLAGGVGALLVPGLAARHLPLRTIAVLRIAGASAILLWFSSVPVFGLIALMVLFALCVDGTEAVYIAEVMNKLPAGWRNAFAGTSAILWSGASAAASWNSGFMQNSRDGRFDLAFSFGMAGYLVSAIAVLVVFPRVARASGALKGAPAPAD